MKTKMSLKSIPAVSGVIYLDIVQSKGGSVRQCKVGYTTRTAFERCYEIRYQTKKNYKVASVFKPTDSSIQSLEALEAKALEAFHAMQAHFVSNEFFEMHGSVDNIISKFNAIFE